MNNKKKIDKEKLLQHSAIFSAASGILATAAFACLPLANNVKWLDVPIIIAAVTALFAMILYLDSVGDPKLFSCARYLFLFSVFTLIVVLISYFACQYLWVKTAFTFAVALICFILWLVLL